MTERYGYGYRDEPGGERPSGRGAVAERRAGQEEEVHEVDLTDEAADPEPETADAERLRDEREASGAFEPHPVAVAGTSIFDVGRDEEAAASGPPEPAAGEPEREAAEADVADQVETEAAEREAAAAMAEPDAAERERTEAEVEAEQEAAATAEPDEAEEAAAEGEAAAEAEPDEAEGEAAAEAEPDEAEGAAAAMAEPGAAEAQAAEEPAAPAAATPEPAAPAAAAAPAALLGSLDTEGARSRFLDIQAGFVDEPRQAVEEAGRFVDELVQRVTDALQGQRSQLQAAGDDASTEDLRLTLRAYRQFVDRLLGLAR
jgi:hypothetical protein